jgi:cysteine protease ATG4
MQARRLVIIRALPRHRHQSNPPASRALLRPRWTTASFQVSDYLILYYVNVYHTPELKTFYRERVRRTPLSGLDPSMLIGFLCKDKADWRDLRRRVGELVFSVQDEPPTWPSDSDDIWIAIGAR